MKFLFDIFPIILFFAGYKLVDIFWATAVAIVGTFIQVSWMWIRTRKVEPMLWVSLGTIVVFGGATLLLRDELFIKWKPTVLYWLVAVAFLVADKLFAKNLVRAMMSGKVEAPDQIWTKLNYAWIVFFAFMGVLNLYVAFNFPTDTWVNFKLFGTMGLTLVFFIGLFMVLAKHGKMIEDEGSQS
jgi:intracellular septation protein